MIYLKDDNRVELNLESLESFFSNKFLVFDRVEVYDSSFLIYVGDINPSAINDLILEIEYENSSLVTNCMFDNISESISINIIPEIEELEIA